MILLASKKKCTGCMSCLQACPVKCINAQEDELGDLYPSIDKNHCIACGACVKACPELNMTTKISFKQSSNAYAVQSLDVSNRSKCASGGAASEFYAKALNKGYWICGAKYEEEYQVKHFLSKENKEISAFRQSKYVYSDMHDIYDKVKKLLQNNEKVLFISLPCKIAGLYSYIGEELNNNLLTIDIVCHGTPPYAHLKKHIEKVANLNKGDLIFRKENEFQFEIINDGRVIYSKVGRQDNYLVAFLEGLNYRPACYNCSYARPERIADITIGDFWGLGIEIPWNHPYTGSISLVLINTEKGRKFWDDCKENLFAEERSVDEALKGNAQLNHSTTMHPKRDEFEKLYKQKGFEKAVEVCLKEEIGRDRKRQHYIQLRQNLKKITGIAIPRYRRQGK